MPNHLHIICEAKKGSLGAIMRDFKSFTAKRIIQQIQENPQESRKELLLYMFKFFAKHNNHNAEYLFWQQHSHPISLESNKWIDEKTQYIWNNPVKAEIVAEPQHYIYSSAYPFTEMKIVK